ncbi:MAG: hypothetical protein H6Q90_5300 [Deltaproteobacteria bacterium]|nr:hypothetical protein [Deltaproteobacteria bacterium]
MMPDRLIVLATLLSACGRIGFDRATPCATSAECATGSCSDGVCCDTTCAGTCDQCITGTCQAVEMECSGDCAACRPSGGGYSCEPDATACSSICVTAICKGAGTSFACDAATCCATSVAPNFVGSCGTAIDVMVPSGCQLEYDVNTCCTGVQYIEVTWDVQACQAGTWVQVDSGADAFPCNGCPTEIRNSWTDSCGNASGTAIVCM